MPPYPLTNFEIHKYCQNKSRFNGVYSKSNLPKIKDMVYVINLDKYKSIGTHWRALYVKASHIVIYFDSFVVGHISKEIKKIIGNKKCYNKYL